VVEEEETDKRFKKQKVNSSMQWMQTIENVAEVARVPFLEVFNMQVNDFLNILLYIVYKNKKIEKQYKK